ncbi:hypothetical protein AYO37_00150 [Opitutia bacterium SCGC AG-212-L18]|nr:hypothetical protein AYO37_00150 [Opitutae bacterium SCGC AG-212-L18]
MRNKSGFSLVEVMLTIVLIGLISGLCYPIVAHLFGKCKDESARCLAESIGAAKKSYWMRKLNAKQEYANKTTDEEQYALIRDYLSDSSMTFDQVLSRLKGYRLVMGSDVSDRVRVFNGIDEI